eukprot:1175339-Prorocentrum_minimum.AAC.3
MRNFARQLEGPTNLGEITTISIPKSLTTIHPNNYRKLSDLRNALPTKVYIGTLVRGRNQGTRPTYSCSFHMRKSYYAWLLMHRLAAGVVTGITAIWS